MRQIVLYVLQGAWNTGTANGCRVLGVAEEREELQDKPEPTAGRRAEEYTAGYLRGGVSEKLELLGGAVKRAAYKIHKAGGCDALDEYSIGYDEAVTVALDILLKETGFTIEDILDYGDDGRV